MRPPPRHPLLLQVDARRLVGGQARRIGRPATLDDVPDAVLDGWRGRGVDWLYLLGVWSTGPASREVSRRHPAWRATFEAALPDLTDADICGSSFAVAAYEAHPDVGGDAAMARLRERLHARGLRLMVDFVPNHVALDHPWATAHPDRFVHGTPQDLAVEPATHVRVGGHVLAHGRDPGTGGWTDTLQLDLGSGDLQRALADELLSVAARADGIRCDMAMLLLPGVFERTWGRRPPPFWPGAIARLRRHHPDTYLLAEVYWDLERELLDQGFDAVYDKRLYDHLRAGDAGAVERHLTAIPGNDQHRYARFLENHDEPRAAATFDADQHRAASVVTFLGPGLRFLHERQRRGARVHVPPHLCRAPEEPVDQDLAAWYDHLLTLGNEPLLRDGVWSWTDLEPRSEDRSAGSCVAWSWRAVDPATDPRTWTVLVNLAPDPTRVRLGHPTNTSGADVLDLVSRRRSVVDDPPRSGGLDLDVDAWGARLVEWHEDRHLRGPREAGRSG